MKLLGKKVVAIAQFFPEKKEEEPKEYNKKPEIDHGEAITIAERGKSSLQPLEVLLFYYKVRVLSG